MARADWRKKSMVNWRWAFHLQRQWWPRSARRRHSWQKECPQGVAHTASAMTSRRTQRRRSRVFMRCTKTYTFCGTLQVYHKNHRGKISNHFFWASEFSVTQGGNTYVAHSECRIKNSQTVGSMLQLVSEYGAFCAAVIWLIGEVVIELFPPSALK